MLGLKLAALYSLPPCRLGFCGQKTKNAARILEAFLRGEEESLGRVRKALESFEAAYPYYSLIARTNSIRDPLDYRVVKAYWVGNSLLENIKAQEIRQLIVKEFTGSGLLSLKEANRRIEKISDSVFAHHSFHVFILGSVTGRVKLVGKLRDLCRVGWGKILEVRSKKLEVRTKSLRSKKGKLYLSELGKRMIEWNPVFVPQVKIGDIVTFHWNQACQVLNQRQQKNLEKYTQINIEAFNEPRR